MEKEIKKLYVCSNYGEFPTIYDSKEKTVGWGFNELDTESLSLTYQRAYNYMRRVNRIYGYNRCYVVSLKPNNYQGWFWNRLIENAQFNDDKRSKKNILII